MEISTEKRLKTAKKRKITQQNAVWGELKSILRPTEAPLSRRSTPLPISRTFYVLILLSYTKNPQHFRCKIRYTKKIALQFNSVSFLNFSCVFLSLLLTVQYSCYTIHLHRIPLSVFPLFCVFKFLLFSQF